MFCFYFCHVRLYLLHLKRILWKNLGRAVWDDPLGMVVPGVMEAWRNPTSSEAWGKAAVDVALFGLTAAKLGRTANLGRAAQIGDELAIFGQTEILTAERMVTQPLFGFTEHGAQRAVQRGITETAIFDALSNPLEIKEIKIDHLGRSSQCFIGKGAEVVINPTTKQCKSYFNKKNRLIRDQNKK